MCLGRCTAAYLAVELEEKLAELEGLQGKAQFGTKAASSTGHVENSTGSASRSQTNKSTMGHG